MFYVYLLRSLSAPKQTYIGFTAELKRRIAEHNSGQSSHTSKFMPWELVTYHAFLDEAAARKFEAYLKSGSGQAFAKRHFW
ncbi:GIY-YIG nuclease family protein [Aestuariivirga sp.]|uniref:GIY-YIG nuclease family protein n=1 Tax=Aestuariivirga sp. TaxID=2650926 RepID=UPI0039E5F92C